MKKLIFALFIGTILPLSLYAGERTTTNDSSLTLSGAVEAMEENDWNTELDEYEKMVDTFIKYCDMMEKGQEVDLDKLEDLLDQATTYALDLMEAEEELTEDQLARLNKITAKFDEYLNKIEE